MFDNAKSFIYRKGQRMKGVGSHALIELYDCQPQDLNSPDLLRDTLVKAAEVAGATLLHQHFHQFAPQGVSGVVVIAESHFSIHTWPEFGYAAIDFFTCSAEMDIQGAYDYIVDALKCKNAELALHDRGTKVDVTKSITSP